jgi:hypothetical protein
MIQLTPIVAVASTGLASYYLIKSYMARSAAIVKLDPGFFLGRDHEAYVKKKLTEFCTVEDWGVIYKRKKRNKITHDIYP